MPAVRFYVRISELEEPDNCPRNDVPCPSKLESGDGPKTSVDIPESEPLISEDLQTPDPKSCQGSDLKPPTHPAIRDLMYIRQQSQETVHHFWARFLLVKDKIKVCRDEDAISVFCNNCTNEGILNANRRHVLHFADLATIVQKYCAMESAWKLSQLIGNHRLQLSPSSGQKGCTLAGRPTQQ